MMRKLAALAALLASLLVPPLSPAKGKPSQWLVLTNVTVVDMSDGTNQPGMTVVIRDDRITAIAKRALIQIDHNVHVVNATGQYLIPGLWDMHVHLADPEREFPLFLANGVLGVRNMGGAATDVFRWREEAASGKKPGPRVIACGPVLDGPQPARPEHAISVHNAEEGRQAVRSLKQMGADFVKVYDGIPREAYFAMADEAKRLHLPFAGHVPVAIRELEATNAGQHSIEHGVGLRGASAAEDEVARLQQTEDVFAEAMRTHNFSLIPESLAKRGNLLLDQYSSQRAQQLYNAFVKNDTYLTPTLVVNRSLTFIDDLSKQDDARMKYIPAAERERWKPENGMLSRYRTPAYIAFRKREYASLLKQVRVAQNAGVRFLAGTDVTSAYTYPGFSLHDELELLVTAGLTRLQALQAATLNPAKFLGKERDLGAVEPGKVANLVLLDADPMEDIRNTRKIRGVVLNGRFYDRAELDKMLAGAEAAAKRP